MMQSVTTGRFCTIYRTHDVQRTYNSYKETRCISSLLPLHSQNSTLRVLRHPQLATCHSDLFF